MSKWRGIDEFLAVANAQSFTAAARALGMSPTHVSRAIIALEQRLQVQLFHRTTRIVRLTDTGRAFLERCEHIAEETDTAIALVGEQGEPQGELRMTCSTAMGESYVASIARRFTMRHPRLSVSIELTNRVVDLVAEGFDLAVRTGKISDTRLIGVQVASRKLYTCAAPTYLARAGRPATVEDLAAHECIVGTSTTWRFNVKGQDREFRPKGRFHCNSGHAVMEACIAGLGVCQLPDFYVLRHLRDGSIDLLLDDARPDEEPIWAVYPRRSHLVPKIRSMISELERELGPALNPKRRGALVRKI